MNSENDWMVTFRLAQQSILSEIAQVQMARSYLPARSHLNELQEQLFAHLKRQDEVLRKLAVQYGGQRGQVKIIEFLIFELKELRVKSLIFFDKYEMAVSEVAVRNFPKDFADFSRAVIERIKAEEEYLLPLLVRPVPGENPQT